MITIQADYRVVTPMFLAGADQSVAEFRLPSFKGVMRYWWRCQAWGRLGDLTRVREAEADLFGSASKSQSRVLLKSSDDLASADDHSVFKGKPGLAWLGYGAVSGGKQRGWLRPGGQISITAVTREGDDPGTVVAALELMGLIGGLGSKSRKGFGSLTLEHLRVSSGAEPELYNFRAPTTREGYADALAERLLSGAKFPPYAGASEHSRAIVIEPADADPLRALEELATRYRSVVEETPSAQRAVFGLPRKTHTTYKTDRRASPFQLHVHAPPGIKPLLAVALVPGEFLAGRREDALWQAASRAMDRLSTPGSAFTHVLEVHP